LRRQRKALHFFPSKTCPVHSPAVPPACFPRLAPSAGRTDGWQSRGSAASLPDETTGPKFFTLGITEPRAMTAWRESDRQMAAQRSIEEARRNDAATHTSRFQRSRRLEVFRWGSRQEKEGLSK